MPFRRKLKGIDDKEGQKYKEDNEGIKFKITKNSEENFKSIWRNWLALLKKRITQKKKTVRRQRKKEDKLRSILKQVSVWQIKESIDSKQSCLSIPVDLNKKISNILIGQKKKNAFSVHYNSNSMDVHKDGTDISSYDAKNLALVLDLKKNSFINNMKEKENKKIEEPDRKVFNPALFVRNGKKDFDDTTMALIQTELSVHDISLGKSYQQYPDNSMSRNLLKGYLSCTNVEMHRFAATFKSMSEHFWKKTENSNEGSVSDENVKKILHKFIFPENDDSVTDFFVKAKMSTGNNKNIILLPQQFSYPCHFSRQVAPELLVNIKPFKQQITVQNELELVADNGKTYEEKIFEKNYSSLFRKYQMKMEKIKLNDEIKEDINEKLLIHNNFSSCIKCGSPSRNSKFSKQNNCSLCSIRNLYNKDNMSFNMDFSVVSSSLDNILKDIVQEEHTFKDNISQFKIVINSNDNDKSGNSKSNAINSSYYSALHGNFDRKKSLNFLKKWDENTIHLPISESNRLTVKEESEIQSKNKFKKIVEKENENTMLEECIKSEEKVDIKESYELKNNVEEQEKFQKMLTEKETGLLQERKPGQNTDQKELDNLNQIMGENEFKKIQSKQKKKIEIITSKEVKEMQLKEQKIIEIEELEELHRKEEIIIIESEKLKQMMKLQKKRKIIEKEEQKIQEKIIGKYMSSKNSKSVDKGILLLQKINPNEEWKSKDFKEIKQKLSGTRWELKIERHLILDKNGKGMESKDSNAWDNMKFIELHESFPSVQEILHSNDENEIKVLERTDKEIILDRNFGSAKDSDRRKSGFFDMIKPNQNVKSEVQTEIKDLDIGKKRKNLLSNSNSKLFFQKSVKFEYYSPIILKPIEIIENNFTSLLQKKEQYDTYDYALYYCCALTSNPEDELTTPLISEKCVTNNKCSYNEFKKVKKSKKEILMIDKNTNSNMSLFKKKTYFTPNKKLNPSLKGMEDSFIKENSFRHKRGRAYLNSSSGDDNVVNSSKFVFCKKNAGKRDDIQFLLKPRNNKVYQNKFSESRLCETTNQLKDGKSSCIGEHDVLPCQKMNERQEISEVKDLELEENEKSKIDTIKKKKRILLDKANTKIAIHRSSDEATGTSVDDNTIPSKLNNSNLGQGNIAFATLKKALVKNELRKSKLILHDENELSSETGQEKMSLLIRITLIKNKQKSSTSSLQS